MFQYVSILHFLLQEYCFLAEAGYSYEAYSYKKECSPPSEYLLQPYSEKKTQSVLIGWFL